MLLKKLLLVALLAISLNQTATVSGAEVAKEAVHSTQAVDHAAPTNPIDTQLIELEKKSWDAWKRGDGEFFSQFLSDDHVEIGFYGVSKKADVVGFVASKQCVVESYSVDRFSVVRFSPSWALVTYHASQSTVCNGVAVPSPVWVSSTYALRHGRWENIAYQQTQALGK